MTAQTKNRETEPSGLGWELFLNYIIAWRRFRPDYFLYENNKSMAKTIRNQIDVEFCRPYAESEDWELVWACEDNKHAWWRYRHMDGREKTIHRILINSALVSAQNRERYYWTDIPDVGQPEDRGILMRDVLDGAETWLEKAYTLDANYHKTSGDRGFETQSGRRRMVAEPVNTTEGDKAYAVKANYHKAGPSNLLGGGGHYPETGVAEAIYQRPRGYNAGGIKHDKAPTLTANGDWPSNNLAVAPCDDSGRPIYPVKDGYITIKGQRYEIKLADGFYIIRKLSVAECMRLQTVPAWYQFPVSDTQAYRMLGNGWTCEVIAHLLGHIPGISEAEVDVLSMYDGMACGRIALGLAGARVTRYRATEIDKYAIKTSSHNFPDIVHLGDAFGVRDWED